MTRPIAPRLHGILDYVAVAVFLLAPAPFGLTGLAATSFYLAMGLLILAVWALTEYRSSDLA